MLPSLQLFTPVSILSVLEFSLLFCPLHQHFQRVLHKDGVAALDALCFDLHTLSISFFSSSGEMDLILDGFLQIPQYRVSRP
jgi:hypothetical protein